MFLACQEGQTVLSTVIELPMLARPGTRSHREHFGDYAMHI